MQISIDSNAAELVRSVREFPARMAQAIASAMNLQNQLSIGYAQQHYLSGPRPARLGVRTNRLRSSLNASPAVISGSTVSSAIGTNVVYAGVHEYGFKGTVTVRTYTRQERRRNIQSTTGRVFNAITGRISSGKGKTIAEGISIVRQHQRKMDIPARPFLAPTLEDRKDDYSKAISAAILASWQGGAS